MAILEREPAGAGPVDHAPDNRLIRARPRRRSASRPSGTGQFRTSRQRRPSIRSTGPGSTAAGFRAWLASLPGSTVRVTADRIVLMAVTAFGLAHVFSGIDFANVQRDLGIGFLLGLGVLMAVAVGLRFSGSMALAFAVLVGFLDRIHREPYTGTDVRAATAEAIRVLQAGGNPYTHRYLDTNPQGSPFAYPIGEPVFYWFHQVLFSRIDYADEVSGLAIILLLAALAPLVGSVRATLVTMGYSTFGLAAYFAMGGSNDTSFAFLIVLSLVLLAYSQSRSVPSGWRIACFVASAAFFGWSILFKQFAWMIYPFVVLALRQRGQRWLLHLAIAGGGAVLAMLPFFVDSPTGVLRNLTRRGIDNDIWGLNIWSILKSFSPALAESLTSFITLPSLILTLVVFVVLLPGTTGDLGAAVLRGLLVIGTLLLTSVWTTFPYYTGASAVLAVAIALYQVPVLTTPVDRYPHTWTGLLPAQLIRTVQRISDHLWGRSVEP